jgi:hypothetical protein
LGGACAESGLSGWDRLGGRSIKAVVVVLEIHLQLLNKNALNYMSAFCTVNSESGSEIPLQMMTSGDNSQVAEADLGGIMSRSAADQMR